MVFFLLSLFVNLFFLWLGVFIYPILKNILRKKSIISEEIDMLPLTTSDGARVF